MQEGTILSGLLVNQLTCISSNNLWQYFRSNRDTVMVEISIIHVWLPPITSWKALFQVAALISGVLVNKPTCHILVTVFFELPV